MDKVIDFLKEDQATEQGSTQVVVDGFGLCQNAHKDTIKAKHDSIRKAEEDRIEAIKQNEIRKQKRREAREKRAKDQALEKFKDEVEKHVIFKGEVVKVLETNLSDVHSNYQVGGNSLCALGGQLMQMYYVLEEIMTKYPQGLKNYMEKKIQNDDDDYFMRPNNPRELLLPEHLMPFFMQFLKDMKNDSVDILLHPKCKQFLDEHECPYDDLTKLGDEDLIKFKDLFMNNRMSEHHRGTGKTMDLLFDYIIDILSKRVPIDNVNVKVDQIVSKIRLVPCPEDLVTEDYTEKVTVEENGETKEITKSHKKNTNETALILMSIPQIEEEEEIKIEVTGKEGEGENKEP